MASKGSSEAPRPRPTIALPPRVSLESLFKGGGVSEVSPGPLTLVSSFFAEDPESECRSFTQLLVGAMNSPAAVRRTAVGAEGEVGKDEEKSRPPSLVVGTPGPGIFTVPPGLSPGGLLDSPLFWPGMGVMSHQEALAQVTAQAAQSPFRMQSQTEFPPFTMPAPTLLSQQPSQETSLPIASNTAIQIVEDPQSDQKSQLMAPIVDKPTDDGYNWRKYGQKMVKGSEFPRSYYKCTHPNCGVTKKVERSVDGHVTEIIYKGQHGHPPPTNKRAKQNNSFLNGSANGNHENSAISEPGPMLYLEDSRKQQDTTSGPSLPRRDRESCHGTPDQVSGSTDSEEGAEIRTKDGDDTEPDPKRRNLPASSQKTLTEPRIIVQTTSEVDLLDDGYRWRKYGQKVVKGNPNPRSYYKCTFPECKVRKHIERSSTDPKSVITTYEGKHNHELPASRNSSHTLAAASAASRIASQASRNFDNNDNRPVAVLELKKEHEIT